MSEELARAGPNDQIARAIRAEELIDLARAELAGTAADWAAFVRGSH
jgi:hypothetical protein